jgi:hypothetical protein
VDYWNFLGWTDRFSSAACTDRQKRYSNALKNSSIYTPQMIVNGVSDFVGSDQARANREIDKALARPVTAVINVKLAPRTPGSPVAVEISASRAPEHAQIVACIAQDGLSTSVKRGENVGRTLTHDCVVRAFDSRPANNAEPIVVTLKLPADQVEANSAVIAFIQDSETMEIVGATRLPLIDNVITPPATDAAKNEQTDQKSAASPVDADSRQQHPR